MFVFSVHLCVSCDCTCIGSDDLCVCVFAGRRLVCSRIKFSNVIDYIDICNWHPSELLPVASVMMILINCVNKQLISFAMSCSI